MTKQELEQSIRDFIESEKEKGKTVDQILINIHYTRSFGGVNGSVMGDVIVGYTE